MVVVGNDDRKDVGEHGGLQVGELRTGDVRES